jgi:tetratricopeptide (TPR) repeat protein
VAGTLVDEDPETALAYARAARDRASRIAVVREAVGVAAYHAGDYAEATRELRAYRRMSGDPGYRAVLADCERALGRPEVALRLVGEALGATTDPDEVAELRLVESGARRDLGEIAAARLVLEAALGGRPTPDTLTADDPSRLRLAVAYADLLEADGDTEQAERWRAAVAEVDPDRDADAVEFLETEEHAEAEQPHDATEPAGGEPAGEEAPTPDGDEPGVEGRADEEAGRLVEPAADEAAAGRRSFDEEVEAEVAELLGETGPAVPEGPSTQH